MSTTRSNESEIALFPDDGDLVLELEFHYRDGRFDRREEGRRVRSVRLADGAAILAAALRVDNASGIELLVRDTHRGGVGTISQKLAIPAGTPLPVLVHVAEIDEYYPDYYHELSSGDGEFAPEINNREISIRVERE